MLVVLVNNKGELYFLARVVAHNAFAKSLPAAITTVSTVVNSLDIRSAVAYLSTPAILVEVTLAKVGVNTDAIKTPVNKNVISFLC
jgi:hypothetical protein